MGLLDINFDNSESQGFDGLNMEEIANLPSAGESTTASDEPEQLSFEEAIAGDVDTKEKEANTKEKDTPEEKDNLSLSLEDILGKEKDAVEPDDNTEKEPSSANDTDNATFLLLGKTLAEEGLLPEVDEEEFNKTVEETGSAAAALVKLAKDKLTEYEADIKKGYEESFQAYMDLRNAGVSDEEAFELTSIQGDLNEIDDDIIEENEQLRKELLTLNYRNTTKWNEDKIAREVKKVVDSGEDIDEAKAVLPELKKMAEEKVTNRLKEQEEANKKQEEIIANNIKTIKDTFSADNVELISNVKLTKAQAKKAEDLILTNKLWEERAKDPIAFDMKLASLMAAGGFEGKIVKESTAKKKAMDELNERLKSAPKASFKANGGASNEADEQVSAADSKFIRFMQEQQKQNF